MYPDSLLGLSVSCGILIVAFILATNGTTDTNILVTSVLIGMSILSLLLGRNAYLSFDQACRQLHLNHASQFRTDRILSSIGLSFGVFQVILFFFAMVVGLNWAMNYAATVLFKTSYLAANQEIYKSISAGFTDAVLTALKYFNSNYLIYLSSFFALIGITYAYIVPNLFTKSSRRKFIRRFGAGAAVFLISYVSQVTLSNLLPQIATRNSYLPIATSVLLAAVTQFLAATYSDVLNRQMKGS